jgi:hypothetical protein
MPCRRRAARGSAIAKIAWIAAIPALTAGCGGGAPPDEAPPSTWPAEAGFIDLPSVEYTLNGQGLSLDTTSSRARIFFSFHPADDHPEDRPLIVMSSGGPGASTAILLGGNTAPITLDAARTHGARAAENPASWTRFANLLHVDARGAGFSYGLANGMDDEAARAAEFSVRNFNPLLDAADMVRVTLRFLASHPALRASEVILAGESYAGIRTSVALHMLHHPERWAEPGGLFVDPALAAEVTAHFDEAGTTAAAQVGRAILLQARLSSPQQQAAAGAALEARGSILDTVAAETGVPFVRCAAKPAPCSPFGNALDYLAAAGRDIYDVRRPAGDAFARYADIGARMEEPAPMALALGVEPSAIAALSPDARSEAYRIVKAAPEDEPLTAVLGALAPHDRYFEHELFDLLGEPFSGAEAKLYGIERQNSRYGRLFLEDLLAVRFFATNAAFDAAIFTPALPAALEMYTDLVASVHMDGEALSVELVPGAFGAEGAEALDVRFVAFEGSGHSVSLDEPDALAADLAAWIDDHGSPAGR